MDNQSQRAPLNQETLSKVPLGPSKLDTYLQQEHYHESLPLGFPSKKHNAGDQVKKLDEALNVSEEGRKTRLIIEVGKGHH